MRRPPKRFFMYSGRVHTWTTTPMTDHFTSLQVMYSHSGVYSGRVHTWTTTLMTDHFTSLQVTYSHSGVYSGRVHTWTTTPMTDQSFRLMTGDVFTLRLSVNTSPVIRCNLSIWHKVQDLSMYSGSAHLNNDANDRSLHLITRWAWGKQVHGMIFFPSVLGHCWLVDTRQEGHPACKKTGCWWWLDWSFARLIAPVVQLSPLTTSIILCFKQTPANLENGR